MRRWFLVPLCLAAIATFPVMYWLSVELMVAAQLAAGAQEAVYSPGVWAWMAVVAVGLLIGCPFVVYRIVRGARLVLWRSEVATQHEMTADDVTQLAKIFG